MCCKYLSTGNGKKQWSRGLKLCTVLMIKCIAHYIIAIALMVYNAAFQLRLFIYIYSVMDLLIHKYETLASDRY